MEPNAFEELNQRYNKCDKKPCLCPSGVAFNSKGRKGYNESISSIITYMFLNYFFFRDWKIIRCGGCASTAVHMKCEGLTNLTYRCSTCVRVLRGIGTSSANPGIQPWINNYIDCLICFASLKSMQDLKLHIKSYHPDEIDAVVDVEDIESTDDNDNKEVCATADTTQSQKSTRKSN